LQSIPFPVVTCPSDVHCADIAQLIDLGHFKAVPNTNETSFLSYNQQALTLHLKKENETLSISVDFVSGRSEHRRQYGGGKSQPLAKACGLDKHPSWTILDATAGLGKDAFVLASLGSQITLIEQHPALYGLLADAAHKAKEHVEVSEVIKRMNFIHADACDYLKALSFSDISKQEAPDVIYLDPMYPHRKKSAKIKKEMQVLQSLVGYSEQEKNLFDIALKTAQQRVVVKRPKSAEPLNDKKPSYSVGSVNTRYDVYVR